MTEELGPFEPGEGRLPPHLAGREPEQAVLRGFVGRLRRRRPAPSSVVLYGPRGNGKTVLLQWLWREVGTLNTRRGAGEAELETLWLTPSELATVADLVDELAYSSALEQVRLEKVGVPGVLDLRLGAGDGAPRTVAKALAARVAQKPLILLLDEAHTLDPEVGRVLLNASQRVGVQKPFLLVLAGTPDLRSHLRQMSASFWPRARQLPIGRLSEAVARDAVRVPLRRDGIGISDGALDGIAAESRCYPFFVQHWGELGWQRTSGRRGAERRVSAADVAACRTAFTRVANLYFLDRYEELDDRRLLPAAWAVADAFGAGAPPRGAADSLPDDRVEAAVRRGLGTDAEDRVREAIRTLFHLGYIWRAGGEPEWEPGIPSLMDYVRERFPVSQHPGSENRT